MKKNILQVFIVLLAVMFLSTSVMATSKKHDKKSFHAYAALQLKVKKLEKTLKKKIKKILKLEKKLKKVSKQKQGPPGPQGPKGDPGPPGMGGGPLVCPGCTFPMDSLFDVNPAAFERLRGAYLPGAELLGTKLSGADLSGADLRGAKLEGADLSGADLSYAVLGIVTVDFGTLGGEAEARTIFSNTDLSGATFENAEGVEDVIWMYGTTCPDLEVIGDDGVETCLGHLE